MRRAAGLATVVVLFLVSLGASRAEAQQQPTVRVSGTTPMSILYGCMDGEARTEVGSFTLERSSSVGALTVTYHISGGPTDLNSDAAAGANHTVDFASGSATATVSVNPTTGGGAARVEVLDGPTYDLGDPAAADINAAIAQPSCPPPSDTPSNTLARTGVRSTTAPLAVGGMVMVTIGATLLVLGSRRKAAG